MNTNEIIYSNVNFYQLIFQNRLVPGQTATCGLNKWLLEVIVMW